jgi:hypothetical protein
MMQMELEDEFTHIQYGKFERFRSTQNITFVDAAQKGLKRGKSKTWTKTSKNHVKWKPYPSSKSKWLSLGTWGEIHALFGLDDVQLEASKLHQFLLATAQANPDRTPS